MDSNGLVATDERHVQLVVVGGGLAGTSAAIAAARKGVSVVLIQERPVLGGNSSSEVRVGPVGASQSGYNRDARETGIIEEIFLDVRARAHGLKQFNGNHYPFWDVILEEKVDAEPNLELQLNTRVVGVSTSETDVDGYERRIDAIWAVQQGTEKVFHFTCDMLIDATGDGFVAFQAGAPFRYGREAKSEFNESWAPETADDVVLGSTIMFAARDVGRPVPFIAPEWAHTFPDEESLPYRTHENFDAGYWWIEWGGRLDTITDNEAIRKELHRAVLGVWDHIKNHCTVPGVRERAATWTMDWIGHIPGKRESRRFEGDHIMTEHDVHLGLDGVPDDVVTHGGWPIDLHTPDGVYSSEQPCWQPPLPGLYGIPLSSLYSRTVSNLMLAGRDISTTHVAHGTTRVMKTCAVIGEAAGVAAAKSLQADMTPRALRQNATSLRDLQITLLRDGLYLPLRSDSDGNLARRSDVSITATSDAALILGPDMGWEEAGTGFPEHKGIGDDRAVALDKLTGQAFVMSESRLNAVSVELVSENETPVKVRMQVRQARHLRDFRKSQSGEETLAIIDADVPPGRSTIAFTPEKALDVVPDRPIVLVLEPAEGVSWVLSTQEPSGTQAGAWDTELGYWRWFHGTLVFATDPVSRPYEANNISSGINRPEQATNMWISDPSESLPQSLTLTWPEPVTIGTIEVTFDSQLSGWIWEGPFPCVVSDYSLHAGDSTLVEVTCNHQRKRVHTIEPRETESMTLTVHATNGIPTARIVEIRVYPPDA
ncbi:MAG TPA: FAD-dependent oxidoreductase [Thermomicrobiales bacterium]|nr:FAD-dependent oxidoreductase [Thermomicrobiales bacterium]